MHCLREFTARWHAPGNPRRGFLTTKQSAGLFCLPSCAFLQRKNFALCAGRPKALPLDSTTFEKVDETLNIGAFAVVGARFHPRPQSYNKVDVGRTRLFFYQVKAAIRRAAARTAIHRALVRAGEPPARVPHDKTVRRTVLSPLLRFFTEKEFRPVRRATKGFAFGFHHL